MMPMRPSHGNNVPFQPTLGVGTPAGAENRGHAQRQQGTSKTLPHVRAFYPIYGVSSVCKTMRAKRQGSLSWAEY